MPGTPVSVLHAKVEVATSAPGAISLYLLLNVGVSLRMWRR